MTVDIRVDFRDIAKDIEKETKKAMRKQQKDLIRELKSETSKWKKPAEYEAVETDDGATIVTDDDRVTWIDEGTAPHSITPKRHRFLKFRPGDHVRNEIARRQASVASQDVAVYAKTIHHPGIKPRNFIEKVMQRQEKDVMSAIEDAVEKAIK